MKYGLLAHNNLYPNVGDSVQSIAAGAFLPEVNDLVIYDRFHEFSPTENYKVILNHYYDKSFFTNTFSDREDLMCRPEGIVMCSDYVTPLLFSMHINNPYTEGSFPMTDKVRKYLNSNGPVGARDEHTKKLLGECGVESYFSGCLTLTLNGRKNVGKGEYVVLADVSPKLKRFLRRKTERIMYDVSNIVGADHQGAIEELIAADMWLDLLQGAHCVVTRRFHVAMPCLALGVPVFFVYENGFNDFCGINNLDEHPRFSGSAELLRYDTEIGYMNHYKQFDIDDPPANKEAYKSIRKTQIDIVKKFIGEHCPYEDGGERIPIIDKLPVRFEHKEYDVFSHIYREQIFLGGKLVKNARYSLEQ